MTQRDFEPLSPEELAKTAGLTYVNDDTPGIRRIKKGRGFAYRYSSGRYVKSQSQRERIAAMAIPPAWTDVWICRLPLGHLQATGRDDRERKQYLYHERWQEISRLATFSRVAPFGRALPRIRSRVARDFRGREMSRRRVLAGMVQLLDASVIRVGNQAYMQANESYGLTTLHQRHVHVNGDTIELSFTGKGGQRREVELEDAELAGFLRRCQSRRSKRSKRLFVYEDDRGQLAEVSAAMLNEYLESVSGADWTAKDFRTWNATVAVAARLWSKRDIAGQKERRQAVLESIDEAAEMLGNTRAVCRDHYVHPGVTEAYERRRLVKYCRSFRPRRRKRFSRDEQMTLHLLDKLESDVDS